MLSDFWHNDSFQTKLLLMKGIDFYPTKNIEPEKKSWQILYTFFHLLSYLSRAIGGCQNLIKSRGNLRSKELKSLAKSFISSLFPAPEKEILGHS